MKQPLMLTHSGLPPAQAEALCDLSVTLSGSAAAFGRPYAGDAAAWPGEDWEDDEGAHLPARAVSHPAAAVPFSYERALRRGA